MGRQTKLQAVEDGERDNSGGEIGHALLEPRQALQELDIIYHTAPVGLCVLDRELRYVRVNDWLAAINGLAVEEHLGRTVREIVPDLADQVEPLMRQVLATGQPVLNVEVAGETVRDPGRRHVWLEQYYPLRDEQGEVVGINVVAGEITERKAEEETYREAESHFRALADSMPQLVWTARPDGVVDYFNERRHEFDGLYKQPDGTWQWHTLVHPDDWPRTVAAWQQAVAGGSVYEVEHRVKRAGGVYHWYLSRGVPQRDEQGQIARWYGTTTDIHAQRLTEEALRTSEEKYRAIFEVSAVGQAEVDPAGCLLAVNDHMCRITGYGEQELLQMTIVDLTHPDDREEEWQRFLHTLQLGEEHYSTKRYVRKDGTTRWVDVRASFIRNAEGRPVRGVKTVVDITERVEAEAEREQLIAELAQEKARLNELNETLETRVHARTRSLEEAHAAVQKARDLFYILFHGSPTPTVLSRRESGEIVDANNAYMEFFGLQRRDVIGRTARALNVFADPADRDRLAADLLKKGFVRDVELRLRTHSDEMRTALVSVALVEVAGESLALSTFIDITPLVEAERQIRHLASELSAAEERERRRIAQILHDDVQQMLVGVQIMLSMHMQDAAPETQAVLQQADVYLLETLEMTRDLSTELSSPAFKSEALKDSFIWVASLMEERYNLKVALDVEEAGSLADENARSVVVRLVLELLFNVVKHAGVSEARLHAWREDDQVVVRVEDDGLGFDPAQPGTHKGGTGVGLASMGERIALFEGRLEIESAPQQGTRVTLRVPINP